MKIKLRRTNFGRVVFIDKHGTNIKISKHANCKTRWFKDILKRLGQKFKNLSPFLLSPWDGGYLDYPICTSLSSQLQYQRK